MSNNSNSIHLDGFEAGVKDGRLSWFCEPGGWKVEGGDAGVVVVVGQTEGLRCSL